jgi:hypothetical protein
MRKLCRQLIAEVIIDSRTFNILSDHIAAKAHEIFRPSRGRELSRT